MKQGRWRRQQISEVLRRAAERRYSMSKVRSSSREEIPHVQGQRNPSKMVGTGAAVRRYPMSKGKGEAPARLEGTNSRLESNPIPTRDAKRAQTNHVHSRTQGPYRDWDRTVFEHLLWRYVSAVDCRRDRGSGCSRPGCGISPLGGGHH